MTTRIGSIWRRLRGRSAWRICRTVVIAMVVALAIGCSPTASPAPSNGPPLGVTSWLCQSIDMLTKAEANLELARQRLVTSDGAGAQTLARLAYDSTLSVVGLLPGDAPDPDLEAVRVKLFSADLVLGQAADVLLIEPLVPTPADLPTYDQGLSLARTALAEARDAIAVATGRGLVACGT